MANPYEKIVWSADVPDCAALINLEKRMPDLAWIKLDQPFVVNNFEKVWDMMQTLRLCGKKVFLDLKITEVDQKLIATAEAWLNRGRPSMLNCMAGSVSSGIYNISDENFDALIGFAETCLERGVIPCAVSVLTSKDRGLVIEEFRRSPVKQVLFYAHQIYQAGFRHMVCSPLEAQVLKRDPDLRDLKLVTPGIRPKGADIGTQSRFTTPSQAIRKGCDYLVIGGPITKAEDPAKALDAIAAEIKPLLV